MLGYNYQQPVVLIGTKSGNTRTSVPLTNAYDVANKTNVFETGGMSKLNFNILYTTGAAETDNSMEVRIRVSPDGVNMYQIVNESVTGGTSSLTLREFTFGGTGTTALTAYGFSLPIDCWDLYAEISVKETGVTTNPGTVYVEATISGAK